MDQIHLKRAAKSSLVVMCIVLLISVIFHRYDYESGYAVAIAGDSGKKIHRPAPKREGAGETVVADVTEEDGPAPENIAELQLGSRYITIPKADAAVTEAVLTDDYMQRSISLSLSGTDLDPWEIIDISRMNGDRIYTGEPEPVKEESSETADVLDEEPSDAVTERSDLEPLEQTAEEPEEYADLLRAYEVTEAGADKNTVSIRMTMDSLYVPFLFEDEINYYIELKKPKEVYDKVLVVDAGHGGKHPGTLTADAQNMEKNYNLLIVLELKKLLDQEKDIKVYYTRLGDDSVYLNPRVALANDAEADYFISVHNNANNFASANGTEVLYDEQEKDKKESSKKLATLCLNEITSLTGRKSRGLVKGHEMYIIGHSNVPAVLIEIAFLSNPGDFEFLNKQENLALTAQGIYNAIMMVYQQ